MTWKRAPSGMTSTTAINAESETNTAARFQLRGAVAGRVAVRRPGLRRSLRA
ncbi:hypothetical protein QAD16_20025 [Stenotrophomonas geniculata]|nr:hypothetical protein [Stenotrophomonas geniculata]MDH7551632.1 hypothetical protein [Stenotrophomonas geniculata]